MKIIKLSNQKIKQIAAGEVIAHPFNALKEIVENAIDAGSENITIHISKNGLEKITIIDDGCGMEKSDLEICTQMHTTSKTSEDEHLFGTHSFGFRGEALASIDAISELTIESNKWKFHKNSVTFSNIERGTKIEIENMFAQLPARLKFLKSSSVEWSNIKQILQKYIINCETITWTIYNNGKKFWHFEKSTKQERIKELFKSDFITTENNYNDIQMEFHLLKEHNNFSAIFVNNRPIKDKAITNYIRSIFKEFFMKQENPSYILFIKIDPMLIDCNVHPTKEEIKFMNYSNIFGMLSFMLSPKFFDEFYKSDHLVWTPFSEITAAESNVSDSAFSASAFSAPVDETVVQTNQPNHYISFETPSIHAPSPKSESMETYSYAQQNFDEMQFVNEADHAYEFITKSDPAFENRVKQNYKIIGQIKNSFIIFETADGVGIFDQHAAHERNIYQQMKLQLNKASTQKLLIPQELNLSAKASEYLEKNIEKFLNKGFVIENNTLISVPHVLSGENLSNFLNEQLNNEVDYEIIIDRLLANIACKKALKANTPLSHEQMHSLLETALSNLPICNHGRPVFKYWTSTEIANWFKR